MKQRRDALAANAFAYRYLSHTNFLYTVLYCKSTLSATQHYNNLSCILRILCAFCIEKLCTETTACRISILSFRTVSLVRASPSSPPETSSPTNQTNTVGDVHHSPSNNILCLYRRHHRHRHHFHPHVLSTTQGCGRWEGLA